ncbi:hypothetical protein TGDOM2_398600 [Toxoplasma gondii GAB2-2007-GAL-DOM2]|uniref:Uncharacterized protein n=2 Tax=Toxoplasma gondii TaxID=5811 RepID=A0A086LCP0_TOXGO|nr:hypothetical protein TGDOM2_398600 [Toxoplasma gondii GAB2-2007-GAL-DOM2]KFG54408.1 hypothetical protein TGFOU_270150B [Toxoplasma gondii FOU]
MGRPSSLRHTVAPAENGLGERRVSSKSHKSLVGALSSELHAPMSRGDKQEDDTKARTSESERISKGRERETDGRQKAPDRVRDITRVKRGKRGHTQRKRRRGLLERTGKREASDRLTHSGLLATPKVCFFFVASAEERNDGINNRVCRKSLAAGVKGTRSVHFYL